MNIYIIGVGGVGGYFGGLLANAGYDVTFVARGEHASVMKDKGLMVKSVKGDFLIKPAQVMESISEIEDTDLILFTVKSYDTESAAKELAAVVKEKTMILTFQNGIYNDERIRLLIPKADVHPGVAYVISAKNEPGIICQTGGLCKLIFGDLDNPANKRIHTVGKLMQDAGINAVVSDDIERDMWQKFLFIVAFSGITGYYRSPIGAVLSNHASREMFEQCVKEAVSVAEALHVDLTTDPFGIVMKTALNTAPESKSSLLVDIEHGRKTEIDGLNGALIRLAEKYGIDVPVNKTIYKAVMSISFI